MRRRGPGFSLPEVLVAILFLSISTFGYIALHERLIYSNWKLEERQVPREEARRDLAGKMAGIRTGGKGADPVDGEPAGLWHLRGEAREERKVRNESVTFFVDTYELDRSPGW